MRASALLPLLAIGCSVESEMSYEEAIAEAEAAYGRAPSDAARVAARDAVAAALSTSAPGTLTFDASALDDGVLALGLFLPERELVFEVDLADHELGHATHTVTFDPASIGEVRALSVSDRTFDVPEESVPDVLAGLVPVRTICSRDGGVHGGRLVVAEATFELDARVVSAPVYLSSYEAGALADLDTVETDSDLVGIDIGVWSTDCKRADDCSAPDCSANILGVTVTGYCSWFETLFGVSCRCIIT